MENVDNIDKKLEEIIKIKKAKISTGTKIAIGYLVVVGIVMILHLVYLYVHL